MKKSHKIALAIAVLAVIGGVFYYEHHKKVKLGAKGKKSSAEGDVPFVNDESNKISPDAPVKNARPHKKHGHGHHVAMHVSKGNHPHNK